MNKELIREGCLIGAFKANACCIGIVSYLSADFVIFKCEVENLNTVVGIPILRIDSFNYQFNCRILCEVYGVILAVCCTVNHNTCCFVEKSEVKKTCELRYCNCFCCGNSLCSCFFAILYGKVCFKGLVVESEVIKIEIVLFGAFCRIGRKVDYTFKTVVSVRIVLLVGAGKGVPCVVFGSLDSLNGCLRICTCISCTVESFSVACKTKSCGCCLCICETELHISFHVDNTVINDRVLVTD